MVNLRLTQEGVSERTFHQRFGQTISEVFPQEVTRLTKTGLLEWIDDADDRRLRLTQRGLMVGNQVFMQFVGQ